MTTRVSISCAENASLTSSRGSVVLTSEDIALVIVSSHHISRIGSRRVITWHTRAPLRENIRTWSTLVEIKAGLWLGS